MSNWSYAGTDPGIKLFTACEARWPMPIKAADAVLEIGSNESDWLPRAAATWPEARFSGVDWRGKDVTTPAGIAYRKADALQRDLYAAASFDVIVSLSAVEHFGLGHYSADPLDEHGDVRIMANAWHWLKPGGWLYVDVPFNPHVFAVREGTSYRTYHREALAARLYPEGVAPVESLVAESGDPRVVCPDWPTLQPDERLRYYVAMLFQKGGA